MASTRHFNLTPGASNGTAGESHRVLDWTHKSIVALVAGGGDYLIQVSNDEVTWFTVGGNITAGTSLRSTDDTTAPIPKAVAFLRVFTTTFNSGDTFSFCGHQPNG